MRNPGNTFGPGSSLFSPSIIRGLTQTAGAITDVTAAQFSGSIQSTTSSFRYDPPGSPIKNTQQIPVDWSKFENHTFFNSAEAKVNTAFDIIINSYPFDGTRNELLNFFDDLTGFEKWIFDTFPKYIGFLHFSGSGAGGDGGTFIKVVDSAGRFDPQLSSNATGRPQLDQGAGPISFDFHLHVPTGSDQGNQVILQRLSGSDMGITLALSSTLATEPSGSVLMLVSSGSQYMSASMSISKGNFQHICAVYDATPGVDRVRLFRNAILQSQSEPKELGSFGYTASPFFIGSGSDHAAGFFGSVSPGISFDQSLSGAIDELRVYHSARSASEQKRYMDRSVSPDSSLKLYYRFNEPTGSYAGNSTVIDSSGASLHSSITNFTSSLRDYRDLEPPMFFELPEDSPVLFPAYPDLIALNSDLLASASDYDTNNPNLITKLIPQHYLQEASIFEGFGQDSELGTINDPYGTRTDFPGGGELGSAQIIASFLFVWAKYFDELKMVLDQFGKQRFVDQIPEGTIADMFLPQLAQYYGLQLPEMFPNASYEQFYGRQAQQVGGNLSDNSLQYVQNQIWRRILSDMNEIIRSKGTLHSIKSLIRDMGINPDSNFRFKEFGGSRTGRLSGQREKKDKLLRSLNFSGSFSTVASTLDPQGIPDNKPHFRTPGLLVSGVARTEPGVPLAGPNSSYNNILTSGSWTFEGTYKPWNPSNLGLVQPMTSSLVRFATSGTDGVTLQDNLFLNLLAYSGSVDSGITGSIRLVFRDTWSQTDAPVLSLPLTGVNIFDGGYWHISFGRQRNDQIDQYASSSWFLRAGRQQDGRLESLYENSVLFDDTVPASVTNATSVLTTTGSVSATQSINVSGSVIHIGSQSIPAGGSLYGLAYNAAPVIEEYRSSFFGGKILGARFWSKALTSDEIKEHVMNPTSVGVENSKVNFNFVTKISGSWERLRADYDFIQVDETFDSSGNITLVDMSQNEYDASATGFEADIQAFDPEDITYSMINPFFDHATNFNKVRVRSWLSQENVNKYGGVLGPLHEIPEDEEIMDDRRFGIEVSAVQALNEDILKIFSTLDSFDNYLGRPELQFSEDYPDLACLRDVYFNRLTDKVNFKTFFEFFKWFDTTVSQVIEALIPRKTKYLGVNYVLEPHMLERPKLRYNTFELYLGPNDRAGDTGQLLFQQLIGIIKRY